MKYGAKYWMLQAIRWMLWKKWALIPIRYAMEKQTNRP